MILHYLPVISPVAKFSPNSLPKNQCCLAYCITKTSHVASSPTATHSECNSNEDTVTWAWLCSLANTRLTLGQSPKLALQAVHTLGPLSYVARTIWSLEEQLAARNSSIPIIELADFNWM